jgi:hypothetical protein
MIKMEFNFCKLEIFIPNPNLSELNKIKIFLII